MPEELSNNVVQKFRVQSEHWGKGQFAARGEILAGRGTRFGPKLGQIDSKWVKSGNFFRSDSVHFGSMSQNGLAQ